MPELVLAILKYFFLVLIFVFLARAVKAMYLDISGTGRGPAAKTEAQTGKPLRPPSAMTVTGPEGSSKTYEIDDELIIGRDEKCQVVLTDTYASQIHARVFRRGQNILLEDMGSTNGTSLNRKRVTQPLPVGRGDTARIGKTELKFHQ